MKAKAIIMGRFAGEKQAALAIDKLLSARGRWEHVHTLFLNPIHHRHPRPDKTSHESTHNGSKRRPAEVSRGGTLDLKVEPEPAAGGVGVKALTASLPDVPGGGGEGGSEAANQSRGIMIAVETSDYGSQNLAVRMLNQCGARDVKCAEASTSAHKLRFLDSVPLSAIIDVSRPNEERDDAALLRPKINPRRH